MATLEKVLAVTPDEERRIKATYERSEKELNEDVEAIQEWLKKQPHLPQNEDEQMIKMMLVINKCSLEKTKKKLDMYYSIKHLVPEFYDYRHPLHPELSLQLKNVVLLPLPKLTPDCHRVYLCNFASDDPSKFIANTYFKLLFMSLDLRMMHDTVLGEYFICDHKNGKLGHVVQFSPALIKKVYTIVASAYSDRVKGVHFINLPPGAGPIVTLITSVLSEKLANRVKVHGSIESLQKAIPKDILPTEYGGTAGTVDQLYGDWIKFVESKNNWIKDLCEKKSDESKRVGEPINSDMFGMCGSFRKLALD